MENLNYTGVKIFSATLHRDREQLGEKITEWLGRQRNINIINTVVTQSPDHCLTLTIFYKR